MSELTKEMAEALASPFPDEDVKWKPQITTKGKSKEPITKNGQRIAGCTAHIDARSVMNRLDEVVGVGGWSDSYTVLLNGANVECTLTVLGVSKSDVGEVNRDGFADAMKSAYSDALKRAAVKFGIGRYLYDMDIEWLPFDGFRILDKPVSTQAPPPPTKAKQNGNGSHAVSVEDLRASLEENEQMVLGFVADRAAMTGMYNNATHALNALKQYDKYPAGYKVAMKAKVSKESAVKLFDWLMDRKDEANGAYKEGE